MIISGVSFAIGTVSSIRVAQFANIHTRNKAIYPKYARRLYPTYYTVCHSQHQPLKLWQLEIDDPAQIAVE